MRVGGRIAVVRIVEIQLILDASLTESSRGYVSVCRDVDVRAAGRCTAGIAVDNSAGDVDRS